MGGGRGWGGEKEVETDQTDRRTASRKTPGVTGIQRVRSRDSAKVSSFYLSGHVACQIGKQLLMTI